VNQKNAILPWDRSRQPSTPTTGSPNPRGTRAQGKIPQYRCPMTEPVNPDEMWERGKALKELDEVGGQKRRE
jgi:hypothetical protein